MFLVGSSIVPMQCSNVFSLQFNIICINLKTRCTECIGYAFTIYNIIDYCQYYMRCS